MAVTRRRAGVDLENANSKATENTKNAVPKTRNSGRRAALGELTSNLQTEKTDVKMTKTTLMMKQETKIITTSSTTSTKFEEKSEDSETESISSRQLSFEEPEPECEYDEDSNDFKIMILVSEYVNDIYGYLRTLELRFPIDYTFLENHRTTRRMRSVLINWLAEVHLNFKYTSESLHVCVAIIDRYLQRNRTVGKETLQLVGIAALFVASKYEEVHIAPLDDLVYVCDESCSRKDIFQMEVAIMKSLEFSFGRPTSLHFLRRYSKVEQVNSMEHALAKYLLESMLIDAEFSHVPPSLQAAAASCLSRAILLDDADVHPSKLWSKKLVYYSTYKYREMHSLMRYMANHIVESETSKYQAIRKKYAKAEYSQISICSSFQGDVIKNFIDGVY